jgi:hypothetical protein
MLFTRYHQERVRKLESEVASLTARIASMSENETRLLSMLQTQHETLQGLARVYQDGLERARKIAEQAEANLANPNWSNGPLHLTEEEEDLKWMADHNVISQNGLQDMLKEAGLDPSIQTL